MSPSRKNIPVKRAVDVGCPPAETAEHARSEAKNTGARERLIQAGLEIFGEYGFAAATTRQIATCAGVNLAAIPYYFGTKEELFSACINSMLDFARERFLALRTQTEAMLDRPGLSRNDRLALLEMFLLAIFDIIADDAIRPYAPLVLREHIMPGKAFDILYERFFQPQHALVTRMVAELSGLAPDAPESILRAHALFGQIFGYLTGRNLVMRRLGRPGGNASRLFPEEVLLLRGIIAGNIRAIFASPQSPESESGAQ